jgi:von Willebrand factor type A domain/Putative Flp pilus-assembly TadE/G-like
MKRLHTRPSSQSGFALMYMAVGLTTLLLFSGLAVDSGRAYAVKAQLIKAVDGAALAAARNLNSGDPRGEAVKVFKANFPEGYLGSNAGDPTAASDFFSSHVVNQEGINVVNVKAQVTLPTTFMRLGSVDTMVIGAEGEAQRRMVDLSLVLDVSSSIGWRWGAVRDAARTFVGSFDAVNDRVALITFGNGANVWDAMPSSRGFNKAQVIADIPQNLPGGSTNMVEGLYRGWDEVRSVPAGQQSGLRVIVLFTDGASNSVPGDYPLGAGLPRALRTWDFPDNGADPDNQTHANPHIDGLYHTQTGAASPAVTLTTAWNSTQTIPTVPFLPVTSWHGFHRSSGIPTSFPLQTNALMVDGMAQNARRGLRNFNAVQGRYPAEVWNINNAARNLIEIIANEARNDDGDYRIRIFTLGMGELVRYDLGTRPEKSEEILKRIANDATSPDFNPDQLQGNYYFAQTPDEVAPAFQALQNQIIRLSK